MRSKFLIALFLLPLFVGGQSKKKIDLRPNIILIMADDMGYSDLGCYGSEINTPNLDQLAKEGVRFREFYNYSICAPTRASLMTGQYPHKAGVGYFDVDLGLPSYQGYLNNESLTLGEVFRSAGYNTFLSGKWHVGGDSIHWPLQRGFDKFYGITKGGANYFNADPWPRGFPSSVSYPVALLENNTRIHPKADSYYFTDAIGDHAINFIDEHSTDNKPFFLYVAFTAPHWPLQAKVEDIQKYRGKFDDGWDVLREKRIEKLKHFGLLLPHQIISDKDPLVPDWNQLTYDEQLYWKSKMEVYAAMVDNMDQNIGKIINKLKALNIDNNTLIVFLSDNGSTSASLNSDPSKRGEVRNQGPIGSSGSYDLVGRNWAYLNNTPLKEYKSNMHEGGICTPFIAWYPAKIKASRIVQGSGHLIDIAPTFYEFAKISYPARYNNLVPNPLVGKSLLPVLFDNSEKVNRSEPLFWERAGNRAVRDGKWKLVSTYPENKWALFDIDIDRGETKDVAKENLEIVQRLTNAYYNWAIKNGVVEYSTLRN